MTDWIEWHGGECPVAKGTLIDVRDDDDFVWTGVNALDDLNTAEMWAHEDSSPANNIVAYRIAKPSKLPEGNRDVSSALSQQVAGTHYKECKIQPVEFSEANKLQYLEGSIVARAARHDKATGKGAEDIRKIIHEAQLLLQLRYGEAA